MRRSRRWVASAIVAGALLAMVLPAAASAVTINPPGVKAELFGENPSFSFGSGTINCKVLKMFGLTSSPAASSVTINEGPFLRGPELKPPWPCPTVGMGGFSFEPVPVVSSGAGAFRVTALSTTSAALVFPGGGYGIEFVNGACRLKLTSADAPVGVWKNGTTPTAGNPSTFKISGGTVHVTNVAEIYKNCPSAVSVNFPESGVGSLSADMFAYALSGSSVPVTLK